MKDPIVSEDAHYLWPYRSMSTGLWMLNLPVLLLILLDPDQGNYPFDASGIVVLAIIPCGLQCLNRVLGMWQCLSVIMYLRTTLTKSIAFYYSVFSWYNVFLLYIYNKMYKLIYRKFAQSFTPGELSMCFVLVAWAIYESVKVLNSDSFGNHMPATVYTACIALGAVVSLLLMNFVSPIILSTACFALSSGVAHLLCQSAERYPYHWAVQILERRDEVHMIYFWLFLIVTAVASLAIGNDSTIQKEDASMYRKWFGILAVIMFLSGNHYPHVLFPASVFIMVALCAMELIRYNDGLGSFGEFLNKTYSMLSDADEKGPLHLSGIFYFLTLALPFWMPRRLILANTRIFQNAGVISVGIGEAAASLGGNIIGRPFWYTDEKKQRSIQGTLLTIAIQLAAIWWFELGDISSRVILLPVIMTTITETYIRQIDTMALPYLFILFLYFGNLWQISLNTPEALAA